MPTRAQQRQRQQASTRESLRIVNKKAAQRRGRARDGVFLPVVIATVLLVAYGCFVIWTASLSIEEASFPRQLLGVGIGTVLAVCAWNIDYRMFANWSHVLMVLDVLLIFSPFIPGLSYEGGGMTGWIRFPIIGLTFQPVELAKLVTVLYMASLTAEYNGTIDSLRDYLKLCVMLCIPFVCILIQGDLGSGIVVFVAGAVIIMMGGPKKEWVLSTIGLLVGLIVLFFAVNSITTAYFDTPLIAQYRLNRLLVFLDPEGSSSSEEGYNLLQSLIAVGSGGFFGRGIGSASASQSGAGFLPEAHTDFVFALLSEEFGFMGDLLLIALYLLLILGTVYIAARTESIFGKLVAVGIVGMWTFQIFENIGMCIGLMPITGIPLPFISFGSSSMMVQLTVVGVVQSVWRHRAKPA